jgi:hypothetical protein
MSTKEQHIFRGTGLCDKCGKPEERHAKRRTEKRKRPQHQPDGDPCTKCNLPAASHYPRERKEYDKARPDRKAERYIVGVDGEGHDLPDGTHIYTYMAAVNEHGDVVAEARNPAGLSFEECMDFQLSIPADTLKFAFSFGYDVTMMLGELSTTDIYYIMRPQFRNVYKCDNCKTTWNSLSGRECPICSRYTGKRPHFAHRHVRGYNLHYFNGALTVRRDNRTSHIWDCFKFFGTAFVEALTDWDIGTPEERQAIREMKDKRGSFQNETEEDVERYCKLECHKLAQMMRKVVDAHERAGLKLTRFDGAGSTATSLLKKNGVKEFKGPRVDEYPIELGDAIKAAFVGGRFENSLVGPVDNCPVEEFDIGSAYPYAQTMLPCMKCGRWKKLTGHRLLERVKNARLAVCRFRVKRGTQKEREKIAWMPLPFRGDDGTICYPTGFTGWAWKEELIPALEGWPDWVELISAWVYDTDCGHEPFSYIPETYRRRSEWGVDGAGKVLKLGMNAGYGKTSQRIGDDPPFKDMVWAGVTTATTRGQILRAIMSAKNRWDVISVATDGIYAKAKLVLEKPNDTGTFDLKKPLGSWEHKTIPEGVFFVKPGLYFRMKAANAKDVVKARGLGRRELYEQRDLLMATFKTWDKRNFKHHVSFKTRRFYGAKHSVLGQAGCSKCKTRWSGVPEKLCPKCNRPGDLLNTGKLEAPDGKVAYGRWLERIVEMNFNPLPKREYVMRGNRLRVRDAGGRDSMPYTGRTTPEGEAARLEREFMEEQPDRQDYIGPADE